MPRRGLRKYKLYQITNLLKEPIAVVGSRDVQVSYETQTAKVVVMGEGPTLLGRNWLSKIRLNWSQIHYTSSQGLHDLLGKYGEEVLGTF